MAGKVKYTAGDRVFAKVKGYPAWPAMVQGRQHSGKYAIFFYGTYETASLKASEIWPYDEPNLARFGTDNIKKRPGYSEGLDQILHSPEIAPVLGDEALQMPSPRPSPKLSKPVVLKKPMRMLDGTPIQHSPSPSPKRPAKREAEGEVEEGVAKRAHLEEVQEATTPTTVSRSGRSLVRPRKFVDSAGSGVEEAKVADRIIEEPRKVWVKLVASGDLVEINLDKDKPARWESSQQKVHWELATARNALRFKQQVEGGQCVPEEVRRKLEEKASLTEEEEAVLRRAALLGKRRKKLQWLKVEQQMVDLHLAIRTSLSASNPQIPRCVAHLTALLSLPLTPLMVKKQPEVVETLRRLRKYLGPLDQSVYSAGERGEIGRGVRQVRERSNTLLTRVAALFPGFDPSTAAIGGFPEYFLEQVTRLGEATKGWTEEKVLGMTEEPQLVSPV